MQRGDRDADIKQCSAQHRIGDEAIDFLKKTYAFCKANNYIMIHKRKRDIGNLISKRYVKVLNNFDSNYYIQVDTDISASSIINSTDFTVSMPFTSTGVLASQLGKPSFYIISEDYYYPGIERYSDIPVYTSFDSIE